MITIVGTGHVFRIQEQVSFIVRNSWPQAVLVELDPQRLESIRTPIDPGKAKAPWFYKMMAQQQTRLAEEFGGTVGGDMLAAVEAAERVGAQLVLIDDNASIAVKNLLAAMPAREKIRLVLSSLQGRMATKKTVERELTRFSDDEDDYVGELREQFPSMMKALIDDRNERMANRIRHASGRFQKIIVVVGDAHVEGLVTLLDGLEVKKIRLKDILDPQRMDTIRRELCQDEVSK